MESLASIVKACKLSCDYGDGETVVIGGLAADQVSNSVSKVPGLSGLPIAWQFIQASRQSGES